MMDYFMWSTTILAIWAAVGPLVGVRYGQELARRNQKAQWIADSKKKEFKELLSALDIAVAGYVKHAHKEDKTADDLWTLNEVSTSALRCVSDRLFILPEMTEHNIREKWIKATNQLDETWNIDTFSGTYRALRNELLALATADIRENKK